MLKKSLKKFEMFESLIAEAEGFEQCYGKTGVIYMMTLYMQGNK